MLGQMIKKKVVLLLRVAKKLSHRQEQKDQTATWMEKALMSLWCPNKKALLTQKHLEAKLS